jgi:hypothetical protein
MVSDKEWSVADVGVVYAEQFSITSQLFVELHVIITYSN